MHYVVAKLSETIPPIHKYHSNNTQIPDKCPPNTTLPSKQGFDHKMTNKNNTRQLQLLQHFIHFRDHAMVIEQANSRKS